MDEKLSEPDSKTEWSYSTLKTKAADLQFWKENLEVWTNDQNKGNSIAGIWKGDRRRCKKGTGAVQQPAFCTLTHNCWFFCICVTTPGEFWTVLNQLVAQAWVQVGHDSSLFPVRLQIRWTEVLDCKCYHQQGLFFCIRSDFETRRHSWNL